MPISVGGHAGANRLLLKGVSSIDIVEMKAAVDQFRAGERRVMPIMLDLSEAN